MTSVTSKQLKRIAAGARADYSKALDRESAAKKATLAAWENYERCHQNYMASLVEKD